LSDWAVFTPEEAHIFGILFSPEKNYALILKRWFGLQFGRFFQKLIWSPCCRVKKLEENP
jgi:hypothetical protein